MNQPLQQRSGTNIGVSPANFAAYQQHVGAPVLTLKDTDTVLWESTEGCVRAPGGTKPKFPGILLTNDLTLGDVEVNVIFIDSTGKEFVIGEGILLSGDGIGPVIIDGGPGKFGVSPFGLCPHAGEKIIARVRSATLPGGKVVVVPYSKDFKIKGQGKGGISDGGVLCLRGDVTSQGVDFAPRKGTSVEPLSFLGTLLGGGGATMHLSNADPVNAAFVRFFFIGPDGVERLLNPNSDFVVPPDAIIDIGLLLFPLLFARAYVQYPSKLRVKLSPSNTATQRVEAFVMVAENDVAKDLAQEAS
jgi:hypothetical protein